MNRKMYWGVAILILLLGTAAVFIIVHELAEHHELNVQLDDAQKLADEINQGKISENKRKSDDPVGTPIQPGDQSGNVLILASENEVAASDKQSRIKLPPDFPVVTGTHKLPFWERLGLDPPDGDMRYRKDKYGNYHKVYRGQVSLGEVKFRKGYAPTLEQHKKMQKLRDEWRYAIDVGNNNEVERLESEMDTLKEAAQGDLPYYDGGSYESKPGESKEAAMRNMNQQINEAGHQLYVEYGLEHISPYR